MSATIQDRGFAIVPSVLSARECEAFIKHLDPVSGAGRRGLLDDTMVAALAVSQKLRALVRPHLSLSHTQAPRPVRAIYFDKSPDANWLVAWHQDLTIAVRDKVEAPGFGPWSVKDGVPHVQPPIPLLENMITVRLHLDDADASNGALKVLPGSHDQGRLSSERIQQLRQELPEHLCAASTGDALLMRPLILHASGRSSTERHRRILHIEYAGFDLPDGMNWAEGCWR